MFRSAPTDREEIARTILKVANKWSTIASAKRLVEMGILSNYEAKHYHLSLNPPTWCAEVSFRVPNWDLDLRETDKFYEKDSSKRRAETKSCREALQAICWAAEEILSNGELSITGPWTKRTDKATATTTIMCRPLWDIDKTAVYRETEVHTSDQDVAYNPTFHQQNLADTTDKVETCQPAPTLGRPLSTTDTV